MIPVSFECYKPSKIDEALELISKYKDEAKVLAGGQSLIPMMKLRFARYPIIIDIRNLDELIFLEEDSEKIKIGALTKHRDIEKSQLINSRIPILSQSASEIADIQVRNMGTIGGSLAHADPSADFPPVMLVLEAQIIAKSKEGERKIEVKDLFTGVFETSLKEDELLTEIHIPIPSPDTKFFYTKFPHPATGFAVVNCAVALKNNQNKIEDIKIAFGGMTTVPYRDYSLEEKLKGETIDNISLEEISKNIGEDRDIISDYYADAEYRKHLARTFFKRAVSQLIEG
ncbi:MAG: xanthine dehydrogenase family protein subunit M [Aquificae bacterium]|nr:xanthine dehydrogenase family protein subunit M [Aquificota bacterium]